MIIVNSYGEVFYPTLHVHVLGNIDGEKITAGWRILWWRSNVVCYAFFSRSLDVARAESAVDLTCSGARHVWVISKIAVVVAQQAAENGLVEQHDFVPASRFNIILEPSRKHSTFLDRLKYNYQSARCVKEGP